MLLPPASVRRRFLAWDRPWLSQVVRWLAGSWDGRGPLDLSRVVAVVPTRQSGRRLREALASFAHEHGQAVFAPRVVTPEALVSEALAGGEATRLESLLAWTEVFRGLELEEFRHVFPVDPPTRNFQWALRLAQDFNRLQVTLAEGGLRLEDVGRRAGEDFVEAARWGEIATLEERHAEKLGELGRVDPFAARIAAATRGAANEAGVARVVVLAVPELPALARQRLVALAGEAAVEIVVFAPESESAAFDEWGQPIPAAWQQRVLALTDFEGRVHLCADPAEQAARMAALALEYPETDGWLALGVADPEVTPLLENELRRAGRAAFNPEGRVLRGEALYELLNSLAGLAQEPNFGNVAALARCPDFLAYLGGRIGAKFAVARWLAGLDELRARHLPADLAAALEHAPKLRGCPELAAGLEVVRDMRAMLRSKSFAEGATAALREIFGAKQLDLARETDARWQGVAETWMAVVRECADAEAHFPPVTTAEWWELALQSFGERRAAEEKRGGALELQGWIELLWEDAPHLVVAGVNDGRVPEAMVENAFLPETLRARLGLETSATRLARDAYLLQAIVAARAGGRVDLLFGKTSAGGEPLRPSRLLLRCADEELPRRIARLFRAPEPRDASSAWTRAWKLTPRVAPPPPKVAVTALRRYLSCPFRFYLRHVLRMETVDPLKSELDAFDFGTLCHASLEQIGLRPDLRDCMDAAVLRGELLRHLEADVRVRYGRNLSLPLLVQVGSAQQRLAKLAELQVAERAEGWRIEQVERAFEIDIGGLLVRGKIDRIDRHEATGALRVIDYKTSDTPVTPAEAHFRALRPGDEAPDWAQFEFGGKTRVWVDLQLPLYLRALAGEQAGRMSCGYFNLPKAAGETALALWEDYTSELHAAAMRCAEGACAAIRAGEYWPPNETLRLERDECAALFHHGVADSVAWAQGAVAAR